ncbi:hypothetical protein EEDFHM_03570 [Methylorubrum populi]
MPSSPSQVLWCLVQLAVIAVLTHGMSVPPEGNPAPINPAQVVVSFGMAVILTALVTRLWDRAYLKLQGGGLVSAAAAGAASAEHHEPVQEGNRLGPRLGAGEVRKPPSSLWRGQQRG